MFLVFGIVSILTVIWLASIRIEETRNEGKRATFGSSFKLLGTRFISLMVLGIFLVVGIDVGINAVSGQFFINKFESAQTFAESGRSVYFFGKMLGTFLGAILLTKACFTILFPLDITGMRWLRNRDLIACSR